MTSPYKKTGRTGSKNTTGMNKGGRVSEGVPIM